MYNLDRHLLKNPRCLASTPKFPALLEVVFFFLATILLMGKVGRCSSESQPLFIVVGLENSQIGSFPQGENKNHLKPPSRLFIVGFCHLPSLEGSLYHFFSKKMVANSPHRLPGTSRWENHLVISPTVGSRLKSFDLQKMVQFWTESFRWRTDMSTFHPKALNKTSREMVIQPVLGAPEPWASPPEIYFR